MTAGEDQPQPVVLELLDIMRGGVARFHVELTRDLGERRVETRAPADPVHGLESSGGNQPGARIRGHALFRPRLDRGSEGLVQRFLRELEIAQQPDQRCEHAPRFAAVDRLDRRADFALLGHRRANLWAPQAQRTGRPSAVLVSASSATSRTSTQPFFAPGIRAAIPSASARSRVSIT